METQQLVVHGARVHNLKNVDLELPKDRLICFTGVSGSGKSSMAFDTIYAEGQRRYIASLSAYARQFMGQLDKPDVDQITGLSPTISIAQNTSGRNPRSTVGTITEINDYLRVLFARIGVAHDPDTGERLVTENRDQIVHRIRSMTASGRIHVMAPLVRERRGQYRELFEDLQRRGYLRVRVDGEFFTLDQVPELDRYRRHSIDVVVDRLVLRDGQELRAGETVGQDPHPGQMADQYAQVGENADQDARVGEAVDAALELGEGTVVVLTEKGEELELGSSGSGGADGDGLDLAPQLFSFNNPRGMCPECHGLGYQLVMSERLIIPDAGKSILDGAIVPFGTVTSNKWRLHLLEGAAAHLDFDLRTPWRELAEHQRQGMLHGLGDTTVKFVYTNRRGYTWSHDDRYEGVLRLLEERYHKGSDRIKRDLGQFMSRQVCAACHGSRLNRQARAVTVGGRSFADLTGMPIDACAGFFDHLELDSSSRIIATEALKEIRGRLQLLVDIGLSYLTLERGAHTLSGGESQRIRLAGQIGSGLVGVLYVLDEPSIGLHHRDNQRLLDTLKRLRDLGNTVIIVEHDEDTIRQADIVVDFGPGAGDRGGELVVCGTPHEVAAVPESQTGMYLAGRLAIAVPASRRPGNGGRLVIRQASHHNLKEIDAEIPLGLFTCVTGVSGSGKSSLINDILFKALDRQLHQAQVEPGRHASIEGVEQLDKVIRIDQKPIGRTPRSNPATYTDVFTPIRQLFARLPEARMRGYQPGRFSFNVKGGRCEACDGNGARLVEMEFLADVWVTCERCEGRRFNRETLTVKYKDRSIADILDMPVEKALEFFAPVPPIQRILQTLNDVGLGYIRLGQPATTLSGGEAQRVKLARELCRRSTGRTLYLLDEPTTGLHFADVEKLLRILHTFADAGNTVVVIEHNMEVIKTADHIIDMGPEGGAAGGRIIACGTPEQMSRIEHSCTGQVLRQVLSGTPWPEVSTGTAPGTQPLDTPWPELARETAAPGAYPGPAAVPAVAAVSPADNQRYRTAAGDTTTTVPAPPEGRVHPAADRRIRDIEVVGACMHNLKNLDVRLPREAMTVISGLSGSGKSSLAFDTIYAEGQRRYVESLSAYARQFLERMEKPRVERITGLSPAIAIEQKAPSRNPRSTVGTVTEVYDYIRALYATLGQQYCPVCQVPVGGQTPDEMVDRILDRPADHRVVLLAPVEPRDNEGYEAVLARARADGILRARIDGEYHDLREKVRLERRHRHRIELVIDRLVLRSQQRQRLREGVERALELSGGLVFVDSPDDEHTARYSRHLSCPECARTFEPLVPQSFSFNHREGMCPQCEGLGESEGLDRSLVIADMNLSVREGAIGVWGPIESALWASILEQAGRALGFDLDTPLKDLSAEGLRALLYGAPERAIGHGDSLVLRYRGVLPPADEFARHAARQQRLLQTVTCSACNGSRLRPESRAVRLRQHGIGAVVGMPIRDSVSFFGQMTLTSVEAEVAGELLNEIRTRLRFLHRVGLGYVTLDRRTATLSGGEAQRIRLASQLGTGLTGVLYLLDEPTIGLHPRDNARLLAALRDLRDLGNTLIVVEHDRDTLEAADHIVDLGPGAGAEGGRVVAAGTPRQLRRSAGSATAAYLDGRLRIATPDQRRAGSGKRLCIRGAAAHNLRHIDVELPLGQLICVTGVSGSGKSSLVQHVLYRTLAARLMGARTTPGPHAGLDGIDNLEKIIGIDQSPIGHSPRSSPATVMGVFDLIRQLFAEIPAARVRGYTPGTFSFNKQGGRCATCEGLGWKFIEMHFLPDVWVECDACHGQRYNPDVLRIRYRGHSIAAVLDMPVRQALEVFSNVPRIARLLGTMIDVGLDYLQLGQSSTTLSGGEAQRLKLATELARPSYGRTLYVLDEPTTGLHAADVERLLNVLHSLVDSGNTVIVVEHNLEVIKTADHVIDLGPEGGDEGGRIVAAGTPEQVAEVPASRTGQYLRVMLAQETA